MEAELERPIKNNENEMRENLNTMKMNEPRDTLMNNQRRDKLKQTLIDRFVQSFGEIAVKPIIEKEVSTFLKRDKLNDYDLQQLEKTIQGKLNVKKKKKDLRKNLSNPNNDRNQTYQGNNINVEEVKLPDINQSRLQNKNLCSCERLNQSRMSGASDLDKFDDRNLGDQMRDEEMKDFQKLNLGDKEKENNKIDFDFSKYADEWDAINMYNKKKFEEDKKREKIKDHEMKLRTRNDLDNQIKQKIKREYEEKLKSLEYDALVDKHLKHLDELEAKKREEIKKRVLKEKEMRDKQLREQYVKKRIEFLKNKKYERALVKENQQQLKDEKKANLERKKAEKLAMEKTKEDNLLRRKILAEEAKKEREDDIRIMEDALALDIKKENERKEYFQKIERNANVFSGKAIETVLKAQKEKMRMEEEKLKEYERIMNERAKEDDERRLKEIAQGKINYRNYLDKQVARRKLNDEYEKKVDLEQGRIWKEDTKRFHEKEKEVARIIREMNKRNLEALNEQVKRGKAIVDHGMSETEKAMNKDILREATQA
jgi:hypothetical protein